MEKPQKGEHLPQITVMALERPYKVRSKPFMADGNTLRAGKPPQLALFDLGPVDNSLQKRNYSRPQEPCY